MFPLPPAPLPTSCPGAQAQHRIWSPSGGDTAHRCLLPPQPPATMLPHQALGAPGPQYTRPTTTLGPRAPGPRYTRPSGHQAHGTPGPWYTRPSGYQAHSAPGPWGTRPTVHQALGHQAHGASLHCGYQEPGHPGDFAHQKEHLRALCLHGEPLCEQPGVVLALVLTHSAMVDAWHARVKDLQEKLLEVDPCGPRVCVCGMTSA